MHPAFTDQLAHLDALTCQIDALRPIDAEQERRVMAKLRLDWNYNSNAMEGNSLSLGEVAALLNHGLIAKGKPSKDHLDIQGHDTVLDLLVDLVRDQTPLTEHLIRGMHHTMLKGDQEVSSSNAQGFRVSRTIVAGAYKRQPNHLETVTGSIYHFALPAAVPALMADLLATYKGEKQQTSMHPVLFAATFHHRFVSIHPFEDGNGRLARILMNLLLMQQCYLPAILRLCERPAYLSALAKADGGEYGALFDLVIGACVRSSLLYIDAAHGKSVDALGDFDKQLKPLWQSG